MTPAGPNRLVLLHSMDPRGMKLGGVETHLRLVLERHPSDFNVLFVGVDELGDMPLGLVSAIACFGRPIDFLPVARIPTKDINRAAARLSRSTTLRFALGALRRLAAIRRAIGRGPACAEVERFEFAPIAWLLGLRMAMLIHNESIRTDGMDSLLKRFWLVQQASEALALTLADAIFCVNAAIKARIARIRPRAARKCEVMSVSIDRNRFASTPFQNSGGIFRVLYAGRLDLQKNPPLMFRTIAAARALIGGALEFHYVGAGDPGRFPEFAPIADFTVRHGPCTAAEVAAVMAHCHAGLMTSIFEGLPCFLLETLSSGRPFVAPRLPQLDPFVLTGVSGFLIDPKQYDGRLEDALAQALAEVWKGIQAGRFNPAKISSLVEPYSVDRQLARLFDRHRSLARSRRLAGPWMRRGAPERGANRA